MKREKKETKAMRVEVVETELKEGEFMCCNSLYSTERT